MSYLDYSACEERIKLQEGTLSQHMTCDMNIKSNKLNLLLHQKVVVQRMLHHETQNYVSGVTSKKSVRWNTGLLADKPGTGKSYIIASLLESRPEYVNDYGSIKQYGEDLVQIKHLNTELIYVPANVIVVPHYLIGQWSDVLNKIPNYVYKISKRVHVQNLNFNHCISGQCILLSSSFYNTFVEACKHYKFSRFIFDEADHLEISRCKTPKCHFVWFISASIVNFLFPSGAYYIKRDGQLQVKLVDGIKKTGFIKSVFYDLERKSMNLYLPMMIFRCTDDFISQSVHFPSVSKHTILCQDSVLHRILEGCLSQDILQHLNADDIKGAKEKLQGQTNASLAMMVKQQHEEQIHNQKQKLIYLKRSILPEKTKVQKVIETEIRIQQLEQKLQHILERMKDATCPICYDVCTNPVTLSCCHNVFCADCLSAQIERKLYHCSMCREPLKIGSIYSEPSSNSKFSKLQSLIQPNKKYLLFTSYDSKTIQDTFQGKVLNGNLQQMNKMIHEFNHGKKNVLILNPLHYGNGLNLEHATDIIFYHYVTPDIEEQVIGRVCRSGVNQDVTVTYLSYENERR